MDKSKQPRRKGKAVPFSWSWLQTIRWPYPGALLICRVAYTVIPFTGDKSGPTAPVLGYRLVNQDSGKWYDIDHTKPQWTCDCPDATYRNRPCKHVRALTAALAQQGGQP